MAVTMMTMMTTTHRIIYCAQSLGESHIFVQHIYDDDMMPVAYNIIIYHVVAETIISIP